MFRLTTLVSALFFAHLPLGAHQDRGSKVLHTPRIPYEPCRGQEPGKFIKDRYACDKFFYCGPNQTAISVDCPHGMIFNDEKDICDFPWNHECIAEKIEDERVQLTTKPASTTTTVAILTSTQLSKKQTTRPTHAPSTTRPTRPTSSHTRPSKNVRCPARDPNKLLFLADKNNCHRYYICYHGHPMPQECTAELHWNPRRESCDLPENAGCSRASTTTVMPPLMTTVSVPRPISCPVRGEQVLPHPEECNYFIYCVNGFPTVQQCPFFHHFDVLSKSCMWQTSAKCISSKKTERAKRGD